MRLWLFSAGLVAILGQVVLLRELSVALYGNELIYVLGMGVWLVWSAVGAAAGRRERLPSGAQVRALLLVTAWALPASLALARASRLLFSSVPGADLPLPRQLAVMALVLLPAALLGLLFQWSAKLHARLGGTLARAYAVESAGGVCGGLLSALLLHAGVQNLAQAAIAGLAAAAASLPRWRTRRPPWVAPLATLAAAGLVAGLAAGARLDRAMTAWTHPALAATRDTPYGRVTVAAAGGQVTIFANDALAFDTEDTAAEELVHLAALQHPAPRRVLILGGGIEGLAERALAHRPQRIDDVELDRGLVELVEPLLPEASRRALADAAVRLTIADPRLYLSRRASTYDVILVGMPEPASAQASRFYTREFFALCAEHLTARGVLAFALRSGENLLTPNLLRRTASIHRALEAVFADVLVLPGTRQVFIASKQALVRDPALLASRLAARGIEGGLVGRGYLGYLLTNDRFAETAAAIAATRVEPNTDARPVCYPYSLLLWLAKFVPGLSLADVGAPGSGAPGWVAGIGAALAAALLALARRGRLLRPALLAGLAGVAGMLLETSLMLRFQMARGVLFEQIGLLLTSFMAGLTAGAWSVERLLARREPSRRLGAALVAGLGLLAVAGWAPSASGRLAGLLPTGAMLLATGVLVSGLFAWASLHRRWPGRALSPEAAGQVAARGSECGAALPRTADGRVGGSGSVSGAALSPEAAGQVAAVGPLYAADLLGGAAGSVAASLILVPWLGTDGTALAVAALAALGLLLVRL